MDGIVVAGTTYKRGHNGMWFRLEMSGAIADYATTRESQLLDEIERLRDEILKASVGGS